MTIFRSAFMISFFTILSRISGFTRDMLVARIVGTGFYADIFFAAFKLTNLLRKLLAEGSLFAAFIPSFTSIKEKYGVQEARMFTVKMFSITFYVLLLIMIFANLLMPQLTKAMAPGFTGEKLSETIKLSYIIVWYLGLISLVSILTGLLNGLQKFSYYAIVPIFLNIVLIIFILFFEKHFKNISYCLAWGVLCGGIIQFLFVYFACVYEKFVIYVNKPSRKLLDSNTKSAYKRMLPAILGGGLTQINTILDMILGSYIASGVSYLYYVDRIFYLPTSVIGTAIGVAILPFISKRIAQNHIEGAHKVIKEATQLALIFVLPAAFALFLLSEVITSTIFERGAFNATDVHFVGTMLRILAVGLPFCVFNKVTSSIFFGYSDTRTPMYITFASVLVHITISLSLISLLGIYAIVLGTAISYFVSFATAITILIARKHLIITKEIIWFAVKIGTSALLSVLFVWFISCHAQLGYNALIRNTSLAIKMLYLFSLISICGILYVGFALIMRINILRLIFHRA